MTAERKWVMVLFADDCKPCESCGEPMCPICGVHYADCACPGPSQEDEYEYRETGEVLEARRKPG